MADPITAATIAGLLLTKFTEGAAGETAKKLVTQLWDAIAARFKGDKRAERALATVEAEKTPESTSTIAVYLEDEMKTVPEFAAQIRQIAIEIQALEPIGRQEMATNLKLDGDLEAEKMTQRSKEASDQTMLKNVEAKNIKLGDLTQEQ